MPRFSDLSKAEQAEVRAALGGGKTRKRPRPSRAESKSPTPYRCSRDGATFSDFGAAERHVRQPGHGGARLEALIV